MQLNLNTTFVHVEHFEKNAIENVTAFKYNICTCRATFIWNFKKSFYALVLVW